MGGRGGAVFLGFAVATRQVPCPRVGVHYESGGSRVSFSASIFGEHRLEGSIAGVGRLGGGALSKLLVEFLVFSTVDVT